MEFIVGLALFVVGGAWAAEAVRSGGRVREASLWTAIVLQVGVIGSLWLDWGYSWTEETALHLILERNVWLGIPHALALLSLLGLLRWGRSFAPWSSLLSAVQSALFIPVLLSVERNSSMSFLAAAPMAAMFAGTLAAFLFLPTACAVLPASGSRWHRIAFGPRERLLAAIEGLRDLGLSVTGPASVFESGAASGRLGEKGVEVSSVPVLFPPAYRLTVRLRSPEGASLPRLPPKPGFAPTETLRVAAGVFEYEGWTPAGFAIEPERLREFVRDLAK